MEHIRTQNIHPRIEIPLVDTLEYDGGDFDTYPERQGWDEDLIFTQRDFGQQPLVVVESFFQRWLYFGFLICTFRIVGISVRTGDFLRTSGEGKQIVTTEKLPRYLQHWRKEYKQDKVKEGGDTKHLHWPRITKILRKVYDYANRYCNEYGQSFEKGSSRSSIQDTFPMSPLTSLSIIALGQAITSAATTIYQTPQADLQMPWGTSSFLRNLLYERGWCPKDISLLCDPRDASIEMQYRLAIMPYSRASTDHRRCTISECVGERVDTDHYSTLHVSTGCTCATPDVEESVLSIIRQGGKPIISITTTITQEAPTIEVVNCERQFPKYVAISHVSVSHFPIDNDSYLFTAGLMGSEIGR